MTTHRRSRSQDGFALVGLIVVIFIILLTLSVAAPTVVRALRREREVEALHRANAYVSAIRRYHIKTGAYPGSLEQLEKTNKNRYLRKKYTDPMTGKPDWRLIKVGENKTTVKGFFGQPLAGLATTGIGSSLTPSSNSPTGPGPSNNVGGSFGGGVGSTSAANTIDTTAAGAAAGPSSGGVDPAAPGGGSTLPTGADPTSGGLRNQSASTSSNQGAPFLGVGLPMDGAAILVVNEKTTYPEWEFLYDPRIEQLRAKVNIFGGGMSSSSSSGLGSLSNNASPSNQSPSPQPTPIATAP